jgi:hypothetical protein
MLDQAQPNGAANGTVILRSSSRRRLAWIAPLAVPASQARLYLINQILGHVDLSLGHVLSWQFLSRELPDLWRMWRALDALLAERVADGG